MTKNKFLKIRVNEEDLFKITENAGREDKKVSEYVLSKVLDVVGGSPVKLDSSDIRRVPSFEGVEKDILDTWLLLGGGIHEYIGYTGGSLETFLTDIAKGSAKQADPVAWAGYVVEKMKTPISQGNTQATNKDGVWYSPATDQI